MYFGEGILFQLARWNPRRTLPFPTPSEAGTDEIVVYGRSAFVLPVALNVADALGAEFHLFGDDVNPVA